MTQARIVLSTAGSREEAEKIGNALVERRLAACVSIVPQVRSIYRWQGKVEQAEELLLIIKTTAKQFGSVRDLIRELHSYELPECVCIELENGSDAYLKWLEGSVGEDSVAS
jgi:periplasmic divalent cation tolerance protein